MGRPRIYAENERRNVSMQLRSELVTALDDLAHEQRITRTELLERLLRADPIIKEKMKQAFTVTESKKQ